MSGPLTERAPGSINAKHAHEGEELRRSGALVALRLWEQSKASTDYFVALPVPQSGQTSGIRLLTLTSSASVTTRGYSQPRRVLGLRVASGSIPNEKRSSSMRTACDCDCCGPDCDCSDCDC